MIVIISSFMKRILSWILVIIISSVVIVMIKIVFWEGFQVPSASMTPTLRIGDVAWVDKSAYGHRWPWLKNPTMRIPDYGDVVVFIHPKTTEYYVKRMVGRPGDTVMVLGRKVYVNGKPFEKIEEKDIDATRSLFQNDWGITGNIYWASHANQKYRLLFTDKESSSWRLSGYWIVPPDHFFVLGDLRDESSDSREWGFVSSDAIVGKVVCVVDAGIKTQQRIKGRSSCHIDTADLTQSN